jgi:hypothetical protein
MATELWNEDIVANERRAEEAKEAAIQFEAVKTHWMQTEKGAALKLNINPSDVPAEIALAPIGQRFLCVLVPLDHNEEPVVSAEKREAARWVREAGIICTNVEFQDFLVRQGLAATISEEDAAQAVRDFCGVSSRSQIRTDPKAMEKFRRLHDAFYRKVLL